jgi:tetratricopeptide (TPR) repeat protein
MDDLSAQGIEHFNAGRFDEALRCFRAAAGPEAGVFAAHVLDASGRAPEAVFEFATVIARAPRHAPAYAGLASLVLRRGPLPGDEALRLCAQAWQAAGDLETAERALRRAYKVSKRDAESRRRLIALLHAREQAHLAAGRNGPADRALRAALALEPRNKESLNLLVEALRRRSLALISAGRLAEAEKALRRALAIGLRGKAPRAELKGMAHDEKSRRLFAELAIIERDKESRRALAEVQLMRRLEDLARQRKSERIRLLHRRAESFITAGRLDPAAAALRKALLLGPRDAPTRRRLAEVLVMSALKRDLMRDGAARRSRVPRGEDFRRQLAKIAAGCAREQLFLGRLEAALRSLRRALALSAREDRVELLRLGAQIHLAAGRPGRAEAMLRRALGLSPAHAETRSDIASILRARELANVLPNTRGRFRRARAAWEAVAKMDPKDGASLIAVSLILRWTSPREERDALSRAVEKGRELGPADRFKALMRLGRYKDAAAVAEKTLDRGLTLLDFRAFSDPWEKDNRPDRDAPQTDISKLSALPAPWREYYLGSLGGPKGLKHFDTLPTNTRYRWMHYNAAMEALFSDHFREAIRWFNIALQQPMDWRAHGYLSEAYVCVDSPAKARAEMAKALSAAPENERAQVYAWWGELELWLGGYTRSLELTTKACAMGAPFAHGWKGAALLKLGRKTEALEQLDAALKLYPKDEEAILWRAEAKRELGRPKEALKELKPLPQQMPWVLFNRALALRDLGDEAGMRSAFESLPAAVIARVRRGTVSQSLEAGLKLARGFRRNEYNQAIWLSRRHG